MPSQEDTAKFPEIYTKYSQDWKNKNFWPKDSGDTDASVMAAFTPPGPPVFGGGGSPSKPEAGYGGGKGTSVGSGGAGAGTTAAATTTGATTAIPSSVSSAPPAGASDGPPAGATSALVNGDDKAPIAPSGGPAVGTWGNNKAVVQSDVSAPAASSTGGVTPGQDAASNIVSGNCLEGYYQCTGAELQVCKYLDGNTLGESPCLSL